MSDDCRRGHPFTDENVVWNRKGRSCRTCLNINRGQRRLEVRQARYLEGWAPAIDGPVARIPLNGGEWHSLIDVADVEMVSRYTWHLNRHERLRPRRC